MKTRTIIAAVAILFLTVNNSKAQQAMRTAYFMDNYTYGYRFNPAFAPTYGHLSIASGNLGVSAETNLGLSTFLYPASDGLTTFLSPLVSNDEFLGKLNRTNTLHVGLDENIFSLAFNNKKGRFTSFEINLRSNNYAALPYDLFRFVKAGAVDGRTDYSISNFGARSDNWLEIAYGLSFDINDNIRAGARIKALAGLGQASVYFSKADFTASDEIWKINAVGELDAYLPKGVDAEFNDEDGIQIDAAEPEDLRPGGYGAAVDLGVTYRFLDKFTASFSINDLGLIKWNNSYKAVTPELAWSFEGFQDVPLTPDEGEDSIGDQFEALFDDIEDCFDFNLDSGRPSSVTGMEAVINAGLEYNILKSLSAGVLLTSHIKGMYSWSEARGILTWNPGKMLGIAGSAAVSNFGQSLGAAVNLKLGLLGLYLGVDSLLPLKEVTPQFIPVGHINTNVNFGLHMAFVGKKKLKVKDMDTVTE